MSMDGQGAKHRRTIAENYNCLSRVHERYRRQTNGWATAYSERERSLKLRLLQIVKTRMWANAQRDGHPAEYRWLPLFNAAKFG